MMSFLKSFFANEKTVEEQALLHAQKQRDVLVVDAGDADEEEQQGGCGTGGGGCGGCACRH